MVRKNIRTTIRLDNSLHTRIKLLALKNRLSFNKMSIYLLELGYKDYIENFENYFESNDNQDIKVVNKNEAQV